MSVLLGGCKRKSRDPLITYYNAEHALSMRYPASWKTEQAQQGETRYRYFTAPPAGPERRAAVTVTLIAGPLGGTIDEYAQSYLAGQAAKGLEESRPGAKGRSWEFRSADGKAMNRLLLLPEENRVYGLHAQGPGEHYEAHADQVREMMDSFTLERWSLYRVEHNPEYRFAVRVPPSWKQSRTFSGGGTFLKQFTSPALGSDRSEQTAHASLSITAEPLPAGTTIARFYETSHKKLGEGLQRISHTPWKDGFVDFLKTETPVSEARSKRFYRVAEGRGYILAFEARADVYPRVARWADFIAASLQVGTELDQPVPAQGTAPASPAASIVPSAAPSVTVSASPSAAKR